MRVVVQRVRSASVSVDAAVVGEIGAGLLLLVGVAVGDRAADLRAAAAKIAGLRIFADDDGLMNRSAAQAGGSVLAVSQFTLLADVRRGRRPSFVGAAPPDVAEPAFEQFCELLRAEGLEVATGRFGAMMQVELVNDGPVTVVVETSDGKVV